MRNNLLSIASTVLVVALLLVIREKVNATTVAIVLLFAVLIIGVRLGSFAAVISSLFAGLSFNFFFLPPYHTFAIEGPQNWVAFGAFVLTALVAGSLSAREKRKAEEAEIRKREVERLYSDLRQAFEKVSEAEALKQSEQMKTAVLDAVTHDLRTPLTSMKAAVTTLMASDSGPESAVRLKKEDRTELLEVVNSEIDRLNRIVEGLIDMARIETGTMEPRRTWSNMDEIVSIALTRATPILSHHQVRVLSDPDLPAVRVDPKAMAEVLYVLIENAVKYSAPGGEVLIQASKQNNDNLKVIVEDQGCGIPAEFREKVFDKFFRLGASERSSRSLPPGLGMGLAIARGIVEAHSGQIWIEPAVGREGTRVSFTIPLHPEKR